MEYITDWDPCELANALAEAARKLSDRRKQCRLCRQMVNQLRPKISKPNVVLVLGYSEKISRTHKLKAPVCRGDELIKAGTLLTELPQKVRTTTDCAVRGMIRSLSPCYGLLIGLAFRELCGCNNGAVRYEANKLAIQLDSATEQLRKLDPCNTNRSTATSHLLLLTDQVRQFVGLHHAALREDSGFELVLAEAQRLDQLKEKLTRI